VNTTDYEISLLRLLEKVTNGTIIEISVTGAIPRLICEQSNNMDLGTTILLKPGVILGGTIQHECPLSRSVGYYLEPVIMLAPFAKKAVRLALNGITTDEKDLSVSLFLKNQFKASFNVFRLIYCEPLLYPIFNFLAFQTAWNSEYCVLQIGCFYRH
jgi:RNA 3'-terminal phosphate cyclase